MKAKAEIEDTKNLYDYWGERLYRSVLDDSRIIINLASKEYSKCIEKYLSDKDKYITVTFCCIFRKNCASVPEERSAIPLQTEQSSAG